MMTLMAFSALGAFQCFQGYNGRVPSRLGHGHVRLNSKFTQQIKIQIQIVALHYSLNMEVIYCSVSDKAPVA